MSVEKCQPKKAEDFENNQPKMTLDEVIREVAKRRDLSNDIYHYLKEYKTLQYGYIKAMADLEDTPPLTWSQLKAMEGKPMWVEYESINRKAWAIVDCFYTDAFLKERMNVALPHDYWYLKKEMMGKTWQAYRKERK